MTPPSSSAIIYYLSLYNSAEAGTGADETRAGVTFSRCAGRHDRVRDHPAGSALRTDNEHRPREEEKPGIKFDENVVVL